MFIIDEALILVFFVIFGVILLYTMIELKIKHIDFKGKTPINKYLYWSGKLSVLTSLIFMLIETIFNISRNSIFSVIVLPEVFSYISSFIFSSGVIIILISYLNLGTNLKLGLPKETDRTRLQTKGIYALSRNPIYIGFNLMCLASSLRAFHPINWIVLIVAVFIHHKQVIAEERYLKEHFHKSWDDYKSKVRRYL